MEIVRGIESLPVAQGGSAVTVGFFDGVHLGHRAVLDRTVAAASERGLVPVAVTFDRHPREILTPGKEPRLLTTLERKAELIGEVGIWVLVVLQFNEDFSRWSPEAFCTRVLLLGLQARHVVVGTGFTFGYRAAGNLAVLARLGEANGFSVEGIPLLEIDGRPVSSSSIRESLGSGELEWPTLALGRRYGLEGRVVRGAGRGAALGFPTANLEVPSRMLLPARGVYAGRASAGGRWYSAAIDVGTNPTFGREPLHVEAFLLDFEGELRGRTISVEFWKRLRDEIAFRSPDDLARQIGQDVEQTRTLVA